MKIGILQTGKTPVELLGDYGSYAEMFMRLIQTEKKRFRF